MPSSEYAKPIPAVTPELAPFFAAAKRRQLAVQKCSACGALRFPPRPLCSACLSSEAEWQTVSGRGQVYSFNVMHQLYHPGFASEIPYAVVVVTLDEGVKFTSNLIGIPPAEIRIGMPVRVVFEDLNDEVTLPRFEPA